MYVIIRKSYNEVYNSTVFGIVDGKYIVFSPEYDNLILTQLDYKRFLSPKSITLYSKVFDLDTSQKGWVKLDDKIEGLEFVLQKNVLDVINSGGKVDNSTLEKAKEIHAQFQPKDFYTINTSLDAENFIDCANHFHDAVLVDIIDDGDNIVFKFDSTWDYYIHIKCDKKSLKHDLEVQDKIYWFYGEIYVFGAEKELEFIPVDDGKKGHIVAEHMEWNIEITNLDEGLFQQLKDSY